MPKLPRKAAPTAGGSGVVDTSIEDEITELKEQLDVSALKRAHATYIKSTTALKSITNVTAETKLSLKRDILADELSNIF